MSITGQSETFYNEDNRKFYSPRILIVEDDTTLYHLWSQASSIVSNLVQIDWATSEIEAEELILDSLREGRQYDLLIVDIFLEGTRTGLDLYKRFGHLFYNHIIITSGTEYQKYVEYLNIGSLAPFCMEKPLQPTQCIEVLKRMLQ